MPSTNGGSGLSKHELDAIAWEIAFTVEEFGPLDGDFNSAKIVGAV